MGVWKESYLAQRKPSLLLLIIVACTGVGAFINVYSVQAILPLLEQDFQASAVEVGGAVGATILAVALISPFIGMISDALGRKKLIVLSIFLLSVPTGLIYFAQSMHEIYLYRFLQGLVVPGIAVVIMAYVGEEYRGRFMTKLMSAYVAGTILGGFLGRFFVGYISEFFNWRDAYLLMAGMNLCISLLVFYALPRSIFFVPDRKISHALTTLLHHLQNKKLIATCFTGASVLFSLIGCFTYINLHLAKAPFNLSPAGLANIFIVYLLGVVITPLAAKLIEKFGFRRTIFLALLISSGGILFTLSDNLALVVLGLAIMSSGVFITQSTAVSFMSSILFEGRSLGMGLYNMFYYFGGVVGAWLCGYAYMYLAWLGTVVVLILSQLCAISIAWLFMTSD